MWEYKATDPSGNELQHWKYIRKYRTSSGKWRYVYADQKTHDEIERNEVRAINAYLDRRDTLNIPGGHKQQGRAKMQAKEGSAYVQQYRNSKKTRDELINKNSVKSIAKSTIKAVKASANNVYNKGKSAVEKLLAKATSSQSSSSRPTSRKKNITSTEIQPVKKRKK